MNTPTRWAAGLGAFAAAAALPVSASAQEGWEKQEAARAATTRSFMEPFAHNLAEEVRQRSGGVMNGCPFYIKIEKFASKASAKNNGEASLNFSEKGCANSSAMFTDPSADPLEATVLAKQFMHKTVLPRLNQTGKIIGETLEVRSKNQDKPEMCFVLKFQGRVLNGVFEAMKITEADFYPCEQSVS